MTPGVNMTNAMSASDDVEELVRERPHFEEGVPRTHVVGVERLREGEHEEGRRRAALFPEAEAEAGDAVACERQSCEHTALQHDLDAVAVGEDTFVLGARLVVHDVGLEFFHAERDGGQGVADEVDPQELCQMHIERKTTMTSEMLVPRRKPTTFLMLE